MGLSRPTDEKTQKPIPNKPKPKNGIFTTSKLYKTRTYFISFKKDKFRDASKAS